MPSAKCGACSRFISPTEAARCNKCCQLYHRACAGLSLKGGKTTVWQCPECSKSMPKSNDAKTPVAHTPEVNSSDEFQDTSPAKSVSGGSAELVLGITAELRLFREELRSIREEFQAFRDECTQLRNSLKTYNERLDGIDNRLSALEQKNRTQEGQAAVDVAVAQLKQELNERDQELLSNDLEITNIPENRGENLVHIMTTMAVKLGVSMEERDIVSVDRIGGRHINATSPEGAKEVRPRPVVVRLARRDVRDELLRAARVRRGATTAELGVLGSPRRFYVNERLTKTNRMLFRQAREAAHRLSWQFVWTKRGRILARQKSGDSAFYVRTEADLQRIFYPETTHNPQ